MGVAPPAAAALGAPLAALQAVSSAGWTRTRASKVAVKVGLGAGLGLLVHAVLHLPWPSLARSATLAGLGLLLHASTRPRARRIAAAVQSVDAQVGPVGWLPA